MSQIIAADVRRMTENLSEVVPSPSPQRAMLQIRALQDPRYGSY